MPAWIIKAVAVVALVTFSGAAGAACFTGHDKRMASEDPNAADAVTMSTHDDRLKLPEAEAEAAPVKTGEEPQ